MDYETEFVESYDNLNEFLKDNVARVRGLSKLINVSEKVIKKAIDRYGDLYDLLEKHFDEDSLSEYEIAEMILKEMNEPMTAYVVAEGECSTIDVYRVKINKCG